VGAELNNRRKLVIALGAGSLVAPLGSFAQQQGKVWRIGVLGAFSASAFADRANAFRTGLHELGYIEGKNIVIESRWADGKYERLPELAAELVRSRVDVIVTHAPSGTLAAKRATSTIPIVFAVLGDAIATGLVASLAHPGGNITGSTFFGPELTAKRLELLKEILPRTRRAAALINPDNSLIKPVLSAMEATANSLKLELQPFEVRGPGEFDSVFSKMRRWADAFVVYEDAMILANANTVADLAAKHRLPSIGFSEFAAAGGLMSYGVNLFGMWHRAAYFVDKIFKGAKPSDIPVEQPTNFETIINMKTAKALGIKIPNSVLVRATKVIE
jgi:putative ABC transport system substrate-binding protein